MAGLTLVRVTHPPTMASATKKDVVLIHSADLLLTFNKNPRYAGRAVLVHSLLSAYEVTKAVRLVEPKSAKWCDLSTFHCNSYVQFICNYGNRDLEDLSESDQEDADMYGLGYDCPLFDGLSDYVLATAASTLTAVDCLTSGLAHTVVNWYGGWHHAHRDEASGFCYVNDIVLAILDLLEHFKTVLYIDVDIHHGDGVEEAFYHSSRVMTVSFHKYSPGFFPGKWSGSGGFNSVGCGPGRFYAVNVPLKDGLRDQTFSKLFSKVLADVRNCFQPSVVVMQCGADMLSGDPIGTFSLTPQGLCDDITSVVGWGLPTLLLGGGGYHFTNTARFWTLCTASVAGVTLPIGIPEHECSEQYSPDFELFVAPSNRYDENTTQYLDEVQQTIEAQLQNISFPST